MAKRLAVSLEAACLARNFGFVAKVWPVYSKWGEMPLKDMIALKCWKSLHLRYHGVSSNFSPVRYWGAWGARGSEFKSRRSDQPFQYRARGHLHGHPAKTGRRPRSNPDSFASQRRSLDTGRIRAVEDPAAVEEICMGTTIDVTIPVDSDAARALENPARRAAAGRYLSGLIKGGRARDLIEEAIAEARREARAKGLSDSEIDAELRAWRSEQRT
ncbi:MAG TPA: hypothetical protein VFX20_14015 [Steroidobacteraceae bacterium]|nr:hypothetical protein [Steroidobacteraceae bacterium]